MQSVNATKMSSSSGFVETNPPVPRPWSWLLGATARLPSRIRTPKIQRTAQPGFNVLK